MSCPVNVALALSQVSQARWVKQRTMMKFVGTSREGTSEEHLVASDQGWYKKFLPRDARSASAVLLS